MVTILVEFSYALIGDLWSQLILSEKKYSNSTIHSTISEFLNPVDVHSLPPQNNKVGKFNAIHTKSVQLTPQIKIIIVFIKQNLTVLVK